MVRYEGEEVQKLVFLCVPGDARTGSRPRRGMVPLVEHSDWESFVARVAKRLNLRGVGGIYAWDGGPHITSIEGLLEIDEGRTLVVIEADEPAAHSPRGSLSDAARRSSAAPCTPASSTTSGAAAGSGPTPATAIVPARLGAESADQLASRQVDSRSAPPPPEPQLHSKGERRSGTAKPHGWSVSTQHSVARKTATSRGRRVHDPEEDKYTKRREDAKLSLGRVLRLLVVMAAVTLVYLYFFGLRNQHVLERIREHSERANVGPRAGAAR